MIVVDEKKEQKRLDTLRRLGLLDTPPEERFDRITRIGHRIFGTKVVLFNLVDEDRIWPKSTIGFNQQNVACDISFCPTTILQDEPYIISDTTKDHRYAENPLVTGPLHVRSYAGVPIVAADGTKPATLCFLHDEPKIYSDEDISVLKDLAAWVEIELNFSHIREALDQRKKTEAELREQVQQLEVLNQMTIERELKMIELKKQLQELKKN